MALSVNRDGEIEMIVDYSQGNDFEETTLTLSTNNLNDRIFIRIPGQGQISICKNTILKAIEISEDAFGIAEQHMRKIEMISMQANSELARR